MCHDFSANTRNLVTKMVGNGLNAYNNNKNKKNSSQEVRKKNLKQRYKIVIKVQ